MIYRGQIATESQSKIVLNPGVRGWSFSGSQPLPQFSVTL